MVSNYSVSIRRQLKKKQEQDRIFVKCLALPHPSCSLAWKSYVLPSQSCNTKTVYCFIKFHHLCIKACTLAITEKTNTRTSRNVENTISTINYFTWRGWGCQRSWRGRLERSAEEWIPCQEVIVPLSILRIIIWI